MRALTRMNYWIFNLSQENLNDCPKSLLTLMPVLKPPAFLAAVGNDFSKLDYVY